MTDYLIDDDGNVNLTPMASLLSHQRDVVLAAKGWHKFSPTVGVDAFGYVNGQNQADKLTASTKNECERVGLPPANVTIVNGQIVLLTPPQ